MILQLKQYYGFIMKAIQVIFQATMFYIINVNIIILHIKFALFIIMYRGYGFTAIIIMYRGYSFATKAIQVIFYATMIIIKFSIETFI